MFFTYVLQKRVLWQCLTNLFKIFQISLRILISPANASYLSFSIRVIFLPGKPNESNEVDPQEHVCQWATLLTLSTLSTLTVGIFTKVDKVDKVNKVDKVEERFYIGWGGSSFSGGCRSQEWRNLSGQSSIVSFTAQQPFFKKQQFVSKRFCRSKWASKMCLPQIITSSLTHYLFYDKNFELGMSKFAQSISYLFQTIVYEAKLPAAVEREPSLEYRRIVNRKHQK